MRNKKLEALVECSVMIALAFALSYVRLWKMPLGGSVTLCSMLPILFIGIKHGVKVGVGSAFVYSLTQLFQGVSEGDVSVVSMSFGVFTVCVLFDYVLPFTLLGLSGILGKGGCKPYVASAIAVFLRFLCHFISGVTIWAQWTPEGWSSFLYSIAYNGGFLLPDFLICILCMIFLLQVKEIRRLVGLGK